MNAYVKGAFVSVLVLVAVVIWYRTHMAELPVNRPPEGYKLISKMEKEGVPDFTLERMDGSPFKLSDQKGKILIVNFWASWCNPCVEEFPSMIKLIDHYKEGLTVVAISTDDDKKDIQAFLKAFGLPRPGFEVVWDKNKDVMKAYGIEKVPESFLVGKDFKLIRKVLGIENWYTSGAVAYFEGLLAGTWSGPSGHMGASAHQSGEPDTAETASESGSGAAAQNPELARPKEVIQRKIPTH